MFPSSISQHSHSSYHQSKHISEQPEGKVSKSGHRCCYLKFYSVFFMNALKQKTDGDGLLPYYLFFLASNRRKGEVNNMYERKCLLLIICFYLSGFKDCFIHTVYQRFWNIGGGVFIL